MPAYTHLDSSATSVAPAGSSAVMSRMSSIRSTVWSWCVARTSRRWRATSTSSTRRSARCGRRRTTATVPATWLRFCSWTRAGTDILKCSTRRRPRTARSPRASLCAICYNVTWSVCCDACVGVDCVWLLCTGERVQIHSSMTIHYHSFLRDGYQRASSLIP